MDFFLDHGDYNCVTDLLFFTPNQLAKLILPPGKTWQDLMKGSIAPVDSVKQHLYQKHKAIYPRQVSGVFARLRVSAVLVLLGLYYGIPWLPWNSRQAVLFDLPERKFYIFGLTFWPQDFFYLAGLLIIAALTLFFLTALAGRLWCGFTCPQTVWTEAFMWIQRKVEGSRNQQIKLNNSPWTIKKIRTRVTLHTLWIAFALWTGFTFVGYFTPILQLGLGVKSFSLGSWEAFWILFYSFATYGNAGWMREQVCIYMCPYARFQSAMFDKNTLIISYDNKRGDPKGNRRKADDYKSMRLGDCIDCGLCVQVCPTGIDIRDGLQYQCIGCAACVDVCDGVMEKMHYPKGLIRYTTENALQGITSKIFRPSVIIHGLILISAISGIIFSMVTRSVVTLDVLRDRNSLYRETNHGLIENIYTLKLINKHDQEHVFWLSATGIADLALKIDGENVHVQAGEAKQFVVRLIGDPEDLTSTSNKIEFNVEAKDNPKIKISEKSRFIGPK